MADIAARDAAAWRDIVTGGDGAPLVDTRTRLQQVTATAGAATTGVKQWAANNRALIYAIAAVLLLLAVSGGGRRR